MHPSLVVRLAALAGGGSSSSSAGAVDVAQYVAALQELRGVLVKAKEEQERLEGELAQVGGQWMGAQHPWLLPFSPLSCNPLVAGVPGCPRCQQPAAMSAVNTGTTHQCLTPQRCAHRPHWLTAPLLLLPRLPHSAGDGGAQAAGDREQQTQVPGGFQV